MAAENLFETVTVFVLSHIPFIFVVVFTALLIIALFWWLLSQNLPLIPFLDANARVSARSAFLVKEQKLENLIEKKGLQEFISSLQNTPYFQYVSKAKDITDFHRGIERAFIDSVTEIRDISPDNFKKVINAYISIYEAKIIKAFFRTRFYGQHQMLNEKNVFSVGIITKKLLEELFKTKSVEDIAVVLANTKYYPVLKKEFKSINEFESELDSFVFEEFVKAVKKNRSSFTMPVLKILNSKFDIMNILLVLKFQSRKIPKDKRFSLLIKNNSPFFKTVMLKLVLCETPEEMLKNLKGTQYFEAFSEALNEFKKDNSFSHFEYKLLKHHYAWVAGQELVYPQGPFPLIAFLSRKEAEKSNLLLLSKALFSKIPEKKVKEMIL